MCGLLLSSVLHLGGVNLLVLHGTLRVGLVHYLLSDRNVLDVLYLSFLWHIFCGVLGLLDVLSDGLGDRDVLSVGSLYRDLFDVGFLLRDVLDGGLVLDLWHVPILIYYIYYLVIIYSVWCSMV